MAKIKPDYQMLIILILVIGGLWYVSQNQTAPVTNESINVNVTSGSDGTDDKQTVIYQEAEDNTDLRLIANAWIVATDAQSICNTLGGIWHYESDWVGCEGVGSFNCNDASHLFASEQCIGAGGNWTCSLNNLYCRK